MATGRDYEVLVAAHLLQSPQIASDYGGVHLKTGGRFFSDFFLRDVVTYGLEWFTHNGTLLPPMALKADVAGYGREGASQANYDRAIEEVFQLNGQILETTRRHVEARMTHEIKARLLNLFVLRAEGGCSAGSVDALFKELDEIRTIGAVRRGGPKRLSDGLLEALRSPPKGVPTGLQPIDEAMSGGGICRGETLLWYGRWGIGKSIMTYHTVRCTSIAGYLVLLWVFETSFETARQRLVKGLLGWPDKKLRDNPNEGYKLFKKEYGNLPLFLEYSPPGSTTKSDIITSIDRVEQEEGRKVDLLAMDYSEKRAPGRDWQQVADCYQEIREICGERQIAGIDVAQENREGGISYQNLLRDSDIRVQLTVIPPDEWRRQQRRRGENQRDEKIPTVGPVYGEIQAAREGKSGFVFSLWMDRSRGVVKPRELGEEEV